MSKHSGEVTGLLPDRLVAERYAVSTRTLERWDEVPGLEFPRAVYIRRAAIARSRRSISGTATTRAGLRTPTARIGTARRPCPAPSAGRFTKLRDIEVR